MLWKASDLEQFSLRAEDGVIGKVVDLYFSSDTWAVRYLVVATGDWLSGREVLVSPMALDLVNGPARVIPARLTREQVRGAPSVDTKKPVSRHYETRYHDFYRWPYYWLGESTWGPFLTPGELARATATVPGVTTPPEEPHLRSTAEVKGYSFEGLDGELGHVEDFIASDETWFLPYLEIDTRNWWPGGKKVLLATRWVNDVSWEERKLKADVSRDAVKTAPEYEESELITRAYELALARHYGLERAIGAFR